MEDWKLKYNELKAKANIQEAAIELLVEKYQSLKAQQLILWAKESAVEKTDKLLCCRWISNNGYIYGSVQWDAEGRRWLNDTVNETQEIEILNPVGDYADANPTSNYSALKERAEKMVEFIDGLINFPPPMAKKEMGEWIDKTREDGREIISAWKEGEKEVQP